MKKLYAGESVKGIEVAAPLVVLFELGVAVKGSLG